MPRSTNNILHNPRYPLEILPLKMYSSELMGLLTSPIRGQVLSAGQPLKPVFVIHGQRFRNTKLIAGHESPISLIP